VMASAKPEPPAEKLPIIAADTPPALAPSADAEATKPATSLVAKSMMGPPDPAALKLIEPAKPAGFVTQGPIPEVPAAAAAGDAEGDGHGPKAEVQRTEFGVDVGGANSVAGLRALWRGLLKSRSNAPLFNLRPIIVIKEGTNGLGMQLRLVAGPLRDAGAAAKICAVLAENNRPCETAIFDGQRLTLKDEPPPAASQAKAGQHRREVPKRPTAPVAEEAPKKPETPATSSISGLFGRRDQ
jgi:hypothetical protein